jgi:hypothetical protein
MGNIETVLSSIAAVLVPFIVAGTMWYGSATTPLNYLVRLVTNGTLDSSKLINEFKLASGR